MDASPKAVVLLSGGMDSTTCLAVAQAQGFELFALSLSYGQRHAHELRAAKAVAQAFEVKKHIIVPLDLRLFGGSALTDDISVPKGRHTPAIGTDVPVTYVPARNTIFLSLALAWAEVLRSRDIFIGVNALDYSGYPDCRPEFIQAFISLAKVATAAGTQTGTPPTVHTPLMHMDKRAIIQKGIALGVDFALTHTCYDPSPDGTACRLCDACILRQKGFADAGLTDPIRYASAESD